MRGCRRLLGCAALGMAVSASAGTLAAQAGAPIVRTTHLPPASTGLIDDVAPSAAHPLVRHAVLRPAPHARVHRVYASVTDRTSLASQEGLHTVDTGPLALQSSVALVMDESNSNVLFEKHSDVALPIASITKLMTSLVVLDAHQNMEEMVEVTDEDLDTEKNTRSRLAIGTILSRRDLMHIALMSSENRAAHALCRNYPSGLNGCLQAMNAKAVQIGMTSTYFNDPTGLSKQNVASASDLAKLLQAASENPTIREFSTDHGYTVPVGRRMVAYHNTNALVSNPGWDIVVQKTGYIVEAGKCLVMKAKIEGKTVLIVLLDSVGKYTRFGDANRIKKWVESRPNLIEATHVGVPQPTVGTEPIHVIS
jgi:serine-type D-Ala-D-Ala endopeptidase (penicillin-binding protein 7)